MTKPTTAEELRTLASLYLKRDRIKEARRAFRAALALTEWTLDTIVKADILRNWGFLELQQGKFIAARNMIDRSIVLINRVFRTDTSTRVKRVAANCYAALGNYRFDAHRYTAAFHAYRIALKFAYASGFHERVTTLMGDLGNVAMRQRQWTEASYLLHRARVRATRSYRYALSPTLLRLGILYAERKDPNRDTEKAHAYFLQSFRAALAGGWKNQAADAQRRLRNLHKSAN